MWGDRLCVGRLSAAARVTRAPHVDERSETGRVRRLICMRRARGSRRCRELTGGQMIILHSGGDMFLNILWLDGANWRGVEGG